MNADINDINDNELISINAKEAPKPKSRYNMKRSDYRKENPYDHTVKATNTELPYITFNNEVENPYNLIKNH